MDWISEILNNVDTFIQSAYGHMSDLLALINGIQFANNAVFIKSLGLIKYILGAPLYTLLSVLFTVYILFNLYVLARNLVNLISGFIPGLKGKIKIP